MAVGDLLSRMEASRSRLFAAITGLTEEQARARPPAGRCVSELLAHLMTWEQAVHRAIGAAIPELMPPPTSSEAPGRATPLPQLVHGLQAARRRTALLLERLDARQFALPAVDPDGERTTVRALLERIPAHEDEHAAEIERIRSWLATQDGERDVVILRPAERSQG
ncbi:MAG TPA: DinB family protein [Dehalococcoidia bacterium]|nr:DinB family protein [Dehalococcoidia bacterium]